MFSNDYPHTYANGFITGIFFSQSLCKVNIEKTDCIATYWNANKEKLRIKRIELEAYIGSTIGCYKVHDSWGHRCKSSRSKQNFFQDPFNTNTAVV